MNNMLSIPSILYDNIDRYFAGPDSDRKAAFLLSRPTDDSPGSAMEITDFIAISESMQDNASQGGYNFQSPALMNTIDKAMESCKSIMLLYSETDSQDDSFNPLNDINKRILFRIAYHYLPTGRHACLIYKRNQLFGKAWLRDSTTEPLRIMIS